MPPFFLVFSIRVMLALCSELGTFSFQVCFFYFSRIGVNFLKTWKNFLVKTFGPRIWKFLVNDLMFFIYFIWIFRVFVLFIHVGMSMKFRKQLMGFFFLLLYRFWGSNLGPQSWELVPLSIEPSCLLRFSDFWFGLYYSLNVKSPPWLMYLRTSDTVFRVVGSFGDRAWPSWRSELWSL